MRRRIVSALRRRTWRFERGQRALLGVERMRAAEGDGLVAAGVAEGSAEDDGDVLAGEALGDDFGAARGGGAGGPADRRRELAEEQRLEAVELAGILAELRAHRAVDGGHARPAPELMEDGGVAVADEQLARDGAQVGGEAQDAVAAAGEDQRFSVAAEGVLELALASRIVAGEVACAGEDRVGEAGDQADLAERADAALELLALEGAGGRDDVDWIAGLERLHGGSVP